MNWTNVTFTPTSGSPIVITGVTNIGVNNGGELQKFSGDGDHYMTTVVNDMTDPTFSITAADINALNQLTPGMRGVFTATWNDAHNRATSGGGALTYTANNAVVGPNNGGGAHRAFGSSTVEIGTESTDGQTTSVSVTAV